MSKSLKMYGLILVIFELLSVSIFCNSNSGLTNIQLIGKITGNSANKLIEQLVVKKIDTIFVPVSMGESNRFFNSVFLKLTDSSKIVVMIAGKNEGKKPFLDLSVNINTKYENYPGNKDTLLRKIQILYTGELIDKSGNLVALNLQNVEENNLLPRDVANDFNSNDFGFAKAEIPEPPRTFWSDIVQPVAFIGTAIITVVLLFTVRSK